MRSRGWVVVLTLALGLVPACNDDDDDDGTGPGDDTFFAELDGPSERPTPVTTDATGEATFDVNGQTVDYAIDVSDIDEVIFAHIHLGTSEEAGPIVVFLFEEDPPGAGPFEDDEELVVDSFTAADIGSVAGAPPISLDSLLVRMRNGTAYVNVHTVPFPAGEIRGQIELD
jgi:hypothetical protein